MTDCSKSISRTRSSATTFSVFPPSACCRTLHVLKEASRRERSSCKLILQKTRSEGQPHPLFDRAQLCPHAIEGWIGNNDLPAIDFSKRVTEKSCDGDEWPCRQEARRRADVAIRLSGGAGAHLDHSIGGIFPLIDTFHSRS